MIPERVSCLIRSSRTRSQTDRKQRLDPRFWILTDSAEIPKEGPKILKIANFSAQLQRKSRQEHRRAPFSRSQRFSSEMPHRMEWFHESLDP